MPTKLLVPLLAATLSLVSTTGRGAPASPSFSITIDQQTLDYLRQLRASLR